MNNKSGIIINALIEKLKKNKHYFGNVVCAETFGTNFAAAEIALQKEGETKVYKIVVIKQANET